MININKILKNIFFYNSKKNKLKIIILCCIFYTKFNFIIIKLISHIDEYKKIEKYLKLCANSQVKLYFSEKKKFPKVSIISAVFNIESYLLRFLKSIQNQNFKDIEIILIDDFSSDNTKQLIKQYQSIDKRIVLIENKKNYGTFKSRNLGILKSTGEYILLPDPDDILSQDCLKTLYEYAIKYNYELIRFNLYVGHNNIFMSNYVNPTPSRPVYYPEIKTKIRFLNMYMIDYEDGVLNYILYRTAKSFYFLKKIGYYYIMKRKGISGRGFNSNTIKFIFIHLIIVFQFSKNKMYEKNMFNIIFDRLVIRKSIIKKLNLMKGRSKFYYDAINKFLENEFVSIKNKNYMIMIRENLKKMII